MNVKKRPGTLALGLAAAAALLLAVSGCSSAGASAGGASGYSQPESSRLLNATGFFGKMGEGAHPVAVSLSATKTGARVSCSDGSAIDISLGGNIRLRWAAARERVPLSYAISGEPAYDGLRSASSGDAAIALSRLGKLSLRKEPAPVTLAGSRFTVVLDAAGSRIELREGAAVVLAVDLERSRSLSGMRLLAVEPGKTTGFYGFGEKAGALDKKGMRLRMWNTDAYGYRTGSDPLYVSIPFFYAPRADRTLGLFLDNPGNTFFDLDSAGDGLVRIGSQTGALDLYLMSGADPAAVLAEYSGMTGRYPLPPEWGLGYQQSRYSYYPQDRVLEIAQTLRDKKLPTDVIYLDIDYMERYKCFTIDPNKFPDPAEMTRQLHEMGFHVVSMIDPGIKTEFETGYPVYVGGLKEGVFTRGKDGQNAYGNVWPGQCVFPDFFQPRVRAWWGPLYRDLLDAGIDGFWNDMNEPSVFNTATKTLSIDAVHREADGNRRTHLEVHNAYGSEMVRASYEGLQKLIGEKRVFLLTRAGFAGFQRYAAKWTGDNTSNWEHLGLNIPMALGLSISGVPMVGADVGGYAKTPEPELFARWMQAGALFPLYRNHCEKGPYDQEPWSFGPEVEEISRRALELRYRMLPLWNQLMREHWASGMPPVRPVWFTYPSESRSWSCPENEFMIGDAVLAVPVTEKGAASVKISFPSGSGWIDLATARRYAGGTDVDYPVDKWSIPLFMRDTAILPWWTPARQSVEGGHSDRVELKLPVARGDRLEGVSASVELLWDDGETTAYRSSGFSRWTVRLSGGELDIVPVGAVGPAPKLVVITDAAGMELARLGDGLGSGPVHLSLKDAR